MPIRRPRLPLTDGSMDTKVADAITVLQRSFDQVSIDVGNLKDGLVYGRRAHNASPTWGPNAVGDIVINSEPEVITTGSEEYILYGWVCTVAGTPGTWEELRFGSGGGVTSIYDITGMYNGIPPDSVQVLRFPAVRSFTLPVNLSGSYGHCQVTATATTVFDIAVDGTSVGTMNFAASATWATFSVASAVAIVAGDLLTIEAPATGDATFEGLSFCIKATL